VIEMREDMRRLAAEQNISMDRGLSGWFLLSFTDPDAEPADRFLGACVTWAMDAKDAVDMACAIDVHPGGEAHARQLPRRAVPDETWCDRLLDAEELAELGYLTIQYDA
jgi:hypothetical protein